MYVRDGDKLSCCVYLLWVWRIGVRFLFLLIVDKFVGWLMIVVLSV